MTKTIKLSPQSRHFQSRFTYGAGANSAKRLAAVGAPAWFAQQLAPGSVPDKPGNKVDDWFPALGYSPQELVKRDRRGIKPGWEVMADLNRWTLMRRTMSNRQLHELMTEFWSNLLHVPIDDTDAWMFRVAYDRTIRKHAFGRFDQMLAAAIPHGAMGLFLDNAYSTKDAPNENLGRELLELHTVGVGHFDERDVLNSSRILTGYRVELWPDLKQWYDKPSHYTGRIRVLDFTHPNKDADGRKATKAYLAYLAHHPATAKRIARRLCVRFVNDDPSADLVRTVARAYTRNDTAIVPTLQAMVAHREFGKSKNKKVKLPIEDTIGTVRALRARVTKPRSDNHFANAFLWVAKDNGQSAYDWPAPNGYPELSGAWIGPGRVLDSMDFHRSLAAGWWPSQGVRYRRYEYWLPDLPATFGDLINHVSLLLHNRKAPKAVRAALAIRTGIPLTRRLRAEDAEEILVQQVLLSLLDSKNHMKR